jgi:hypothetical protein
MKALQNGVAGFLVSFIGSLPLGYLNIFGFGIYKKFGIHDLAAYLLGVIVIESVVVYCSLIIAVKLTKSTMLIKILDFLSILFLLLLACFFFAGNGMEDTVYIKSYAGFSPFTTGVILSSLNFSQLPFWTGWGIYLINNSYIAKKGPLQFVYIVFSMVGTLCGMLLFVYILGQLSSNAGTLLHFVMAYGISLVFVCMAMYNAWQFYKKYYRYHGKKHIPE